MIQEAANLIAEFDAAAARVFVSRPFHRAALAKAFRAGFRTHSDYTLKVCALIDGIVHLDQINRQVEA
jgi:hypothetical protein